MAKDHIVPQTYLRGFASDGTGPPNYRGLKLWVFNKVNGHHSQASIKSVAVEDDFESLPPGHPDEPKMKQFAENVHRFEDQWPRLRTSLELIARTNRRIDSRLRTDLANYISCQFVRTSTFRSLWKSGREDLLARGVVPPSADMVNGKLTEEQMKVFHAELLTGEHQVQFAKEFAARSWLIGNNATGQPFFTSDNPVVGGLSPYGSSTFIWAFPITSRLILVMGERNCDCVQALADEDLVYHYNKIQVNFSHKRIFCSVDHEELCRSHCLKNPKVCDPDLPAKAGVAMANNDYAKSIEAKIATRVIERKVDHDQSE